MTKQALARIAKLEQRSALLPRPRAPEPITLSEFIARYTDLLEIADHLGDRVCRGPAAFKPWASLTAAVARQLIEAVQAEDERARAEGKPLASEGFMGLLAQEAEVFIRELEAKGAA